MRQRPSAYEQSVRALVARGVVLSVSDDATLELWVGWDGPETLAEFVERFRRSDGGVAELLDTPIGAPIRYRAQRVVAYPTDVG